MKAKRCGNCGSNNIKTTQLGTRGLPFRDYPLVMLSEPTEFWHCQDCGELILSVADTKKLDELIEASITSQINQFIEAVMTREKCKQSELSVHLGVSPEYLSEIKSGRKIPKFQTFNFLKTLACEPGSFAVSDPKYRPKSIPA